MARQFHTCTLVPILGLFLSIQAGCSSGAGQSLGLSPPQHRLLEAAKDFRAVSPAPEGPRELQKVLHPPHVVEPGDVLLVQPAELDAPVRIMPDQPVAPDGTIDLGPYGRPVVAGKTLPEIEADVQKLVKARLKPDETATINVRIVNRNSKVYYVLGEVNAPGAFPITGRETALDAIIAAGGLTRRASQKNIILSRPTPPCGQRVLLPVCYPQIVQLGDTTTNYQVMAGDRIFVPSQSFMEGLCPGEKRKDCGPCQTPQMLAPMERPGCGMMGCPPGPPAGGVVAPPAGMVAPPAGVVVPPATVGGVDPRLPSPVFPVSATPPGYVPRDSKFP